MKRFLSIATVTALALTGLTACSSSTDDAAATDDTAAAEETSGEEGSTEEAIKVGMTTDSGTIDDKSYNQGTWEGIVRYEESNPGKIKSQYLQPSGETKEDYMSAYANLVDSGHKIIISPGYKFENAIFDAQSLYPDVNFVILDGSPHNGDYNAVVNDNTESIYFAEEESGFYAGVSAALTSKTGKVSYIGGMEIPSVQRFGWGYVAGVAYANKNLGTDVTVSDYMYQGTFTDVAAGKTLAAQFYDNGSDVVFAAAGGVGIGVIDEAKTRRKSGEEGKWVIGVDVDQFAEGDIGDGNSVILTSATKGLNEATYTAIDEILKGEFKGGQTITMDSSNNGVGLPAENPNLSDEAKKAYEDVYAKVAAKEITVPKTSEELTTYLTEQGYKTPDGVKY